MVGILWDLDGTLLNTLDDLTDAANYTLAQFGCPERTKEEVRQFVGNGVLRLIEQAAQGSNADVQEMMAVYQQYYRENCRNKTKPYDGVAEVLEQLGEKYPMAIVSNKPDAAVKALCSDYFPKLYAVGESARCPRKPAPDMVWQTMEKLGVDRCVYIGDSEVDVLTAQNAKVPCISVTWGFRDEEQLQADGARYFCRDVASLQSMIEKVVATL